MDAAASIPETVPMSAPKPPFDSVESAIQAIAEGELVIVTDDEDRENEGDLIMAASKVTPEKVNMMIRYGSGIVCVPMIEDHLRRLGLGPMVAQNREGHRTDFTVSVDAAQGVSTGISAYDRTCAIKILADLDSQADELVQPGHVFPLRARPGGVLERAGHTEAAVDLAVLAGLPPSGIICELVNEDGSMQRLPELTEFKERFGLKMISIAQLIAYRSEREELIEKLHEGPFETDFGTFVAHIFRNRLDQRHHLVLSLGELTADPTLVRVHSANILTDVFQGKHTGGHRVLQDSLQAIAAEGRGVFLYLEPVRARPDMVKHLKNQDSADAPKSMDMREYGIGAQVLKALGLEKIRLLSSSQKKMVGLDGYGIEIVEQVGI